MESSGWAALVSPPGRRALGVGTRHAGFGPLVSCAPGFTLRLRLQGQPRLDVLSLGPHERAGLPTLSVVRAFIGEPTTMPSAEFRAAMTALAGTARSGAFARDADLRRQDRPPSPHSRRIADPSPRWAWISRLPAGCTPSRRSLHAPSIPRHRLVPRIWGPFRGARRGETGRNVSVRRVRHHHPSEEEAHAAIGAKRLAFKGRASPLARGARIVRMHWHSRRAGQASYPVPVRRAAVLLHGFPRMSLARDEALGLRQCFVVIGVDGEVAAPSCRSCSSQKKRAAKWPPSRRGTPSCASTTASSRRTRPT